MEINCSSGDDGYNKDTDQMYIGKKIIYIMSIRSFLLFIIFIWKNKAIWLDLINHNFYRLVLIISKLHSSLRNQANKLLI